MPRRRKPVVDNTRHKRFAPGDIPPDLVERGWQYAGPTRARRVGPHGETAWCSLEFDVDSDGQLFTAWLGGVSRPSRTLDQSCYSATDMMWAIEDAEQQGPLSNVWRKQRGTPQFSGWAHRVKSGCDIWTTHRSGRERAVVQLPCRDWFGLHYAVILGPRETLNGADGTPLLFDKPAKAVAAAERAADENMIEEILASCEEWPNV